uniref:CitMHS domain-containing protein n=1 Tax=Steinernema glaseri TaxID=37863 RepID=A0A1I8AAF6_9BILA
MSTPPFFQEFTCAFCVGIMAVYWMCEVMPLAVTAMLPVALFPLTGVMTSKEVAREYFNDTNFLFIGGLIVAVAVEKCGLHTRIALIVLNLVGKKPKCIMFGFMAVTALLSMFISNTATTAMMVPIGRSIIKQLIEGGGGTSLLDNKVGKNENILKHANPEQKKMAKGLLLSICFAANIGGTGTITGTPPNLVMLGQLETLFPSADTGVNYLSFSMYAVPVMVVCLLACWGILVFVFLRNAPELSPEIMKSLRETKEQLPKMSFAEKAVSACFLLLLTLWVTREPGFVPGLTSIFPKEYFTDATSAIVISIMLFALPTEMPSLDSLLAPPSKPQNDIEDDGEISPRKTAKNTQAGRLMDWSAMQEKFPWSVVILLGGGFALAAGVKASGLSNFIGEWLAEINHTDTYQKQAICLAITMLVTNICSNTVTASIFIPIVASMAQETDMNPLTLMLPTTLACSFAFILPVGTPPNAIVFGSGDVKVTDMMFCGTLTSVATGIIVVLYMKMVKSLMFSLDQFPEWAHIANATLTP